MSQPTPRSYLGSAHNLAERVRVYWTEKGLEVDSSEGYEIRRTRVFFDEIQLVTLHSQLGGAMSLLSLILALLAGIVASALTQSEPLSSRAMWWTALALAVLAAVLFVIPKWVVTVFGRRTRARLIFRLRERKARDIFARICQAADEAQRGLRASAPSPEPERNVELPPPPPLPLSDSEPPITPA